MVEFAEGKIDCYDPDSGKGYFQLQRQCIPHLRHKQVAIAY